MGSIFRDIQPAVRKETKRVAVITVVGVALMWIGFGIFHWIFPKKVPFDYTVFLGGLGGGLIAVLNFFLMGLTVQKVASSEDEEKARLKMKASYSQRMLLQMVWVVIAIAAPCFQFVAGLLPLLFPGFGIKILGIARRS
ncbi:MAG: ATP synthase subunit I [Oliverpabstia sp.]|nr:ATP synthase subunit I [Oliverpabstia sp.]